MLKQARLAAQQCPGTQVILAGYSQGAMVTHEASLAAPSNVKAALLIANVYRSLEDKTIFKGTGESVNQGIAHNLISVPSPLTGKPVSITVCLVKDIVCDSTGVLGYESAYIHSNGYLDSSLQKLQAETLRKTLNSRK